MSEEHAHCWPGSGPGTRGRSNRASLLGSVVGAIANLVVIHDGVERFYPHGVNVPVQDYPLGAVVGHVGQVSHDGREEA